MQVRNIKIISKAFFGILALLGLFSMVPTQAAEVDYSAKYESAKAELELAMDSFCETWLDLKRHKISNGVGDAAKLGDEIQQLQSNCYKEVGNIYLGK